MELAMIGLGKMGMNMATRLVRGGHRVVGFARTAATVDEAVSNGAEGAHSLEEAVSKLNSPRIVWVMVPAGKTTDDTIDKLSSLLSKGDIVIDGGNSNYKDSVRHAAMLEPKAIDFVDCGTSGGIWGISEGYSMMIGRRARSRGKDASHFRDSRPGRGQRLGTSWSARCRTFCQNDSQRN